jgi:hypothetical protein
MKKPIKKNLQLNSQKIRTLEVKETQGIYGASMCSTGGGGPCHPPHSAGLGAGLEPCLPPSGQE